MIQEGLSGRASGGAYVRPRDFSFAFGVAMLTAGLHTVALAAEFVRAAESRVLTSGTVTRLLVLIEICLLINVAGLWVRKAAGLWVSTSALLVAGVGYAGWYAYSRQVMALLSPQPFYQLHAEAVLPHLLGFVGATWLNILVLMASTVLLIWEAKTLFSTPR